MTSSSSFTPAAAGALSGACQVLAEHPLDSLKVRLQSRLVAFEGVGGPIAMLRHTVHVEGAAALLQGLGPRLLSYSAVKLSLFSLYERSLVLCNGSPAAAGALAGAANTVLSCPQDVLKSRLQVVRALGPDRCPSMVTLARQLVRDHGLLVFYRGWSALVARGAGLLHPLISFSISPYILLYIPLPPSTPPYLLLYTPSPPSLHPLTSFSTSP